MGDVLAVLTNAGFVVDRTDERDSKPVLLIARKWPVSSC
jgi:hypothetical protein